MLVCLAERGYISQVLPDERFQLTLKLFELAHRHHPLSGSSPKRARLWKKWRTKPASHVISRCPATEKLWSSPRWTLRQRGLRFETWWKIDLLNTASGHPILAFQPDEVRARSLAAWRRRTDRTLPPDLAGTPDAIRERGYEEMASYQVAGVGISASQF